jgi:hypothetical protein
MIKKPLNAENCAKKIEKNPPKHECTRVVKKNLKYKFSIASIAHCFLSGGACSNPGKYNIFKLELPPSQDDNAGLYLVPINGI